MHKERALLPLVALLSLLLASSQTTAQQPELRYNLWLDGLVTLGSASFVIGTQAASRQIQPETCRWCEGNSFDDSLREAFVWSNPKTANRISSVLAFEVVPLNALGALFVASSLEQKNSNFPVDALLTLEAAALAMSVQQIVKSSIARQRPFVHAIPSSTNREWDPEDNVSFFSGHTTLAFSLATSAGTVAWLRRYRFADWIWASGIVAATCVGYLRIAADKHYASDVLVGALVGSSLGIGVPYFAHRPIAGVKLHLVPTPGGVALSGAF